MLLQPEELLSLVFKMFQDLALVCYSESKQFSQMLSLRLNKMTKQFAPLKSKWHFFFSFLPKESSMKGGSFSDLFPRHNDEHKKGKERNIMISFGPFIKRVRF